MNVENVDGGVLAAFALKLVNIIVGAITSFVALRFFDDLPRRERWMTFVGGWSIAAWGAAPLREYFEMKPSLEVGIVIILGLFGMAVVSQVIKAIKETDWKGLIKGVIDFLLRRNNGGGGSNSTGG